MTVNKTDPQSSSVVEATFPTQEQAEQALRVLVDAGFKDASLEMLRPEDVLRASSAADAAQSAMPAEQPDPTASAARVASIIANTNTVENGGVRVTVAPGARMEEAKRILREHGDVNR